MAYVFAPPVPNYKQPSARPGSIPTRKRKRRAAGGQDREPRSDNKSIDASRLAEDEALDAPEEYAAVLSPEERRQRRQAGFSLTTRPPSPPFPHRSRTDGGKKNGDPSIKGGGFNPLPGVNQSLRVQHIAAMTAVLHKSLLQNDYARARRALGLLLRTEIGGKSIDIRAGGNWSIGAEILFRQLPQDPTQHVHSASHQHLPFTRQGFEQAKALYEKLVVQYPFHPSSLESVNAIDFYLAQFNLWVYVVRAEHNAMVDQESAMADAPTVSCSPLRYRTEQQLEQANEIAAQMDRCMTTAPFSDNEDLVTLRADVALWQAHLNRECQRLLLPLSMEEVETRSSPGRTTSALGQLSLEEHDGRGVHQEYAAAASQADEQARRLFRKLGRAAGPATQRSSREITS